MQLSIKVVFVLLLMHSSDAFTKSKFKSVKCVSLNETVAKIRYCYLKAYSRTYVSLNYGESRKLPLEKPVIVSAFWKRQSKETSSALQIKGSIKYRYGTIFREVLRVDFDLCSVIDGATHPVGKAFLNLLKDTASPVFKNCPLPAVSFIRTASPLQELIFL